eukprot:7980757-Heterocapsa_arctica.AAC.1
MIVGAGAGAKSPSSFDATRPVSYLSSINKSPLPLRQTLQTCPKNSLIATGMSSRPILGPVWKRIPVLEGRAVPWAVKHVCRSVDNH